MVNDFFFKIQDNGTERTCVFSFHNHNNLKKTGLIYTEKKSWYLGNSGSNVDAKWPVYSLIGKP